MKNNLHKKLDTSILSKFHYFNCDESGFTIIELLIVVVVIGIMAAVGVPTYTRYLSISRAAEAPMIMKAIIEYAEGYADAHVGDYPIDDGWEAVFTPDNAGSGTYFTYAATDIAAGGVITATGIAAADAGIGAVFLLMILPQATGDPLMGS